MKNRQYLKEVRQLQKLAGLLKETWHPDDPSSGNDDTEWCPGCERPVDQCVCDELEEDDGFDTSHNPFVKIGLRVFVDENAEQILEFTDVFSEKELWDRIRAKEAEDPIFAKKLDIYLDSPHQMEVADENAQYLYPDNTPIESLPSTYKMSFKEWAEEWVPDLEYDEDDDFDELEEDDDFDTSDNPFAQDSKDSWDTYEDYLKRDNPEIDWDLELADFDDDDESNIQYGTIIGFDDYGNEYSASFTLNPDSEIDSITDVKRVSF